MVLRDPTYIDPKLKGLYIWESSEEKNPDPQDGKKKIGVQITPLKELLDKNCSKEKNLILFEYIYNNNYRG
mgnify:CR=1 FL=1